MKTAESRAPRQKLYWCTSPDHWEDWFVIAPSKRLAKSFFSEVNGYAKDDVTITLVATPLGEQPGARTFATGFAENDDIVACGGKLIIDEAPRVVQLHERVYREGCIQDLPGIDMNTERPMPGENIWEQCAAAIETLNRPASNEANA